MMSEDMSDIINNVKNMVDSGNIPDSIKEMLGNLNNTTTNNTSNINNTNNTNNEINTNSSTNSDNNTHNGNNFNIDIETMLKMKSIVEAMNQKDDPRANLLHSLKPYLRDSRKNKLDQYVNLLNMTKIADFMRNDQKENNNND